MHIPDLLKQVKNRRRKRIFIWWPIVSFVLLAFVFATYTLIARTKPRADVTFGVTYSISYTEEPGLDWQEVFDAMTDDLEVKHIRLPIYWDQVEPLPDRFDFSKYDYIFQKAEENGIKLIPAVGRRLPRWPECHSPGWATGQVEVFRQQRILQMIERVVERYKNSPSIVSWQVDNEPLFSIFGECPLPDREFLEE